MGYLALFFKIYQKYTIEKYVKMIIFLNRKCVSKKEFKEVHLLLYRGVKESNKKLSYIFRSSGM